MKKIFSPRQFFGSSRSQLLEVRLLWGENVVDVSHYRKPAALKVGDDSSCDFQIAQDKPFGNFELIRPVGSSLMLNWRDDMRVRIWRDEELVYENVEASAVAPLSHSCELGSQDRASIQIGEFVLEVGYVSAIRRARVAMSRGFDFYFPKVLTLAAVMHVCIAVAIWLTPKLNEQPSVDFSSHEFEPLMITGPQVISDVMIAVPKPSDGRADKGEAGEVGRTDAKLDQAAIGKHGSPTADLDAVLNDPLIASLRASKSAVLGTGGLGEDVNNIIGGWDRDGPNGDRKGHGGRGIVGDDRGGGGDELSVGFGDQGGNSEGTDLSLKRKKAKANSIEAPVEKIGCLSKAEVMRDIARIEVRARACYERSLAKHPGAEGKIVSTFDIGAEGQVIDVRIGQDTLKIDEVSSCLQRVIRHRKFSPCEGGGTATVTFPWVFKEAG